MASKFRKILLLGKTGVGKSSVGNTLFGGKKVFSTSCSPKSLTKISTFESRFIDGRTVTLIDTPGFFDTRISEDELKSEIIHCITESAGGVHAFIIVLKVERYTVHENEICTQIRQSFSDEAFKYATVLFTHGDDLEGKTIQDFVKESDELNDLVQKCGGRCHVIDNKRWNQDQQDKNSINQVRVSELLKTIDQTVEQNGGSCYTNKILQAVQELIQAEENTIRVESGGELSEEEIHRQATQIVETKLHVKLAGIATGVLVGAVLGAVTLATLAVNFTTKTVLAVGSVARAAESIAGTAAGGTAAAGRAAGGTAAGGTAAAGRAAGGTEAGRTAAGGTAAGAGTAAGTAAGGTAARGCGIAAAVILGAGAVLGGIGGGIVGYDAAEGKETAGEAIEAAATAVYDKAKAALDKVNDLTGTLR